MISGKAGKVGTYYLKRRTNPKAWPKDEEQRLLDAFDAGVDISELMQIHGRSRKAIVIRLHRLGRILPGESVRGD